MNNRKADYNSQQGNGSEGRAPVCAYGLLLHRLLLPHASKELLEQPVAERLVGVYILLRPRRVGIALFLQRVHFHFNIQQKYIYNKMNK